MALPLSLHGEQDRSVLLDDSDEDVVSYPRRSSRRINQKEPTQPVRIKETAPSAPVHPIPAMQPAFAESLMEATHNTGEARPAKPKLRFGDAKERRTRLLDGSAGANLHGTLWRYRPGQEHHELWKLLAQISFGVYLMLNGIANNNDQVVDILQGHIDEVDEFLETTLEDVKLGIDDIRERIELLKLPMGNMKTFETMLEDREFRLEIVTRNEKIEHIVERTTFALDETFKDIDEGFGATKEFAVYLSDQQGKQWRHERSELIDIFDAMKGNAQGWYQALLELRESATTLDNLLVNLSQMVAEMEKVAGEVSRRTRFTLAPFSGTGEQSSSKDNPSRSSLSPTSQQSTSLPLRIVSQIPRPDPSAEKQVVYDEEKEVVFSPPSELHDEAATKRESHRSPGSDGPYLLQPTTYKPQPPASQPSPTVQRSSPPQQQDARLSKRSSLRQRVSLKGGNLPDVIHVPPMNLSEIEQPRFRSPRNQPSPRPTMQRHGSELGAVSEARSSHSSGMSGRHQMTAPSFPNTIPSPRSDQQQYFYPVRASPHSPLQQRPHTSATARSHTTQTTHLRNQRSAMGMSMLSNVTNADSQAGGKTLKKKKSTFGWLKKAFTLDDDEKAEFEARKQQQSANAYYSARSPKFLDGKRLPTPQPYR